MSAILLRLGHFSVRRRWPVVGAWLFLLVVAGFAASAFAGKTVSTFGIPGQESTVALEKIEEHYGAEANHASAQVVFRVRDAGAIDEGAYRQAVDTARDTFVGLPAVRAVSDPFVPPAQAVSTDRRAAYVVVSYDRQAPDLTKPDREALLAAVDGARGSGLEVEVTGRATQTGTQLGHGEIVGIVVALLVLVATYGSLIAAGMNMLTAVVGVGIGTAGITAATGFVELQSTTPILAVMLGLAVGIDYALFIVTRFRQELREGQPVPQAAATATATAGTAVVVAGVTVVIGLVGLAVARIPFLTEMGVAAASSVVVAVAAALTLVPATLGILGARVQPRRQRREGTFFARWGAAVTRRRWTALVGAALIVAVAAVPVLSMRTTLATPWPDDSTQTRAQAILAQQFGPGLVGSLTVLVEGPAAADGAAALREAFTGLEGVAAVAPPTPAKDGAAAIVTVVPDSGPSDDATSELVERMRATIASAGVERAYVTGQTAVGVDVAGKLRETLPIYLLLVVGLAFVLLTVAFRSILVPVVGVAGFLLTTGASLGAMTAVHQHGWMQSLLGTAHTGPLLSLAPIIVVGILFGLAMDYQVFLVSRIHELHSRGTAAREAVRLGFRQAAPIVVAAAAIMFAVFAGFVPGGDPTIQPIALALAVGVLVDAIVVRMVAVPAALAILGDAAWWLPRWLRWLPAFDLEGTSAKTTVTVGS